MPNTISTLLLATATRDTHARSHPKGSRAANRAAHRLDVAPTSAGLICDPDRATSLCPGLVTAVPPSQLALKATGLQDGMG